jgi:hypothetical protein
MPIRRGDIPAIRTLGLESDDIFDCDRYVKNDRKYRKRSRKWFYTTILY